MASENGKFKVGDRVRCVDASDTDCVVEGELYTIEEAQNSYVTVAGGRGMYAHRFELVPAWQPKVGDRVRLSEKSEYYCNDTCTVGTVTNYPSGFDGTYLGVIFAGDDFVWNFRAEELTAEPATATLTIEAGKFYKTRDGRKVGPVYSENGYYVADGWHYNKNGECGLFGTHNPDEDYRDDKDIVALWEEPASNDNAAVAKPKFKVGDRVVVTGNRPGLVPKIGKYGVVSSHKWEGYMVKLNDGGDFAFVDEELTPESPPTTPAIVALIENGTPRPSTAPKVHTSQEAATTEAERLALEHPGQQFGVFVLADSKVADLVMTQTAVLRAA